MIKQPGHYPPCMPQVSTPAEKIEVALQRFNSELALFLIVATEHDFWIYSWFWGWCVAVRRLQLSVEGASAPVGPRNVPTRFCDRDE